MDGLTFFLKQLCFDQADPNFEYFVLYLYLYLIGNALNTPFFFLFFFSHVLNSRRSKWGKELNCNVLVNHTDPEAGRGPKK